MGAGSPGPIDRLTPAPYCRPMVASDRKSRLRKRNFRACRFDVFDFSASKSKVSYLRKMSCAFSISLDPERSIATGGFRADQQHNSSRISFPAASRASLSCFQFGVNFSALVVLCELAPHVSHARTGYEDKRCRICGAPIAAPQLFDRARSNGQTRGWIPPVGRASSPWPACFQRVCVRTPRP